MDSNVLNLWVTAFLEKKIFRRAKFVLEFTSAADFEPKVEKSWPTNKAWLEEERWSNATVRTTSLTLAVCCFSAPPLSRRDHKHYTIRSLMMLSYHDCYCSHLKCSLGHHESQDKNIFHDILGFSKMKVLYVPSRTEIYSFADDFNFCLLFHNLYNLIPSDLISSCDIHRRKGKIKFVVFASVNGEKAPEFAEHFERRNFDHLFSSALHTLRSLQVTTMANMCTACKP